MMSLLRTEGKKIPRRRLLREGFIFFLSVSSKGGGGCTQFQFSVSASTLVTATPLMVTHRKGQKKLCVSFVRGEQRAEDQPVTTTACDPRRLLAAHLLGQRQGVGCISPRRRIRRSCLRSPRTLLLCRPVGVMYRLCIGATPAVPISTLVPRGRRGSTRRHRRGRAPTSRHRHCRLPSWLGAPAAAASGVAPAPAAAVPAARRRSRTG